MLRLSALGLALILASTAACPGQGPEASPQPQSAPAKNAGIKPPVPIETPEPQFPEAARFKKLSGSCFVSVTVDKSGNPQDPKVLRCTDMIFAQNSLAAVAEYRFKPARDRDGNPVPVMLTIEISFRLWGEGVDLSSFIRYTLQTPPGVTSTAPDASGVYPLTKAIEAPKLTKFSDEGFSKLSFAFRNSLGCDVVLTVSKKGKPADPHVTHCDNPAMQDSVVASLLQSRYKPGRLNGKPIPVRFSIHIAFAGFAAP